MRPCPGIPDFLSPCFAKRIRRLAIGVTVVDRAGYDYGSRQARSPARLESSIQDVAPTPRNGLSADNDAGIRLEEDPASRCER